MMIPRHTWSSCCDCRNIYTVNLTTPMPRSMFDVLDMRDGVGMDGRWGVVINNDLY